MTVGIGHYVALSAVMFFIGVTGVLVRRNPLIVLMSIELMFNAANLALVAFSREWVNNAGHIFVFLVDDGRGGGGRDRPRDRGRRLPPREGGRRRRSRELARVTA